MDGRRLHRRHHFRQSVFTFHHFFLIRFSGTDCHIPATQANGAFSEYLVADAELQVVPILGGWSSEEAAQLGVAPVTALQCLHETLELPSPFNNAAKRQQQHTILIWGGALAVGQCTTQRVRHAHRCV